MADKRKRDDVVVLDSDDDDGAAAAPAPAPAPKRARSHKAGSDDEGGGGAKPAKAPSRKATGDGTAAKPKRASSGKVDIATLAVAGGGGSLERNRAMATMLRAIAAATPTGGDASAFWRIKALNTAAEAIEACAVPIASGTAAVKGIKGVGKGVGAKIDEFIAEGTMREYTALVGDKRGPALAEVKRVYGLSDMAAHRLVDEHGVTGLDDLRSRPEVLESDAQRVALQYVDELEAPIPHTEAAALEAAIGAGLGTVDGHPVKVRLPRCGSMPMHRHACEMPPPCR